MACRVYDSLVIVVEDVVLHITLHSENESMSDKEEYVITLGTTVRLNWIDSVTKVAALIVRFSLAVSWLVTKLDSTAYFS